MNLLHLVQRPPRVQLLFLHLPRTGGDSLSRALSEVYLFDFLRPRRKFIFSFSANASRLTAGLHGLTDAQIRDVVLHYGLLTDSSMRLVLGHFRYTAKIIDRLGSAWSLATVLREPTSRWLSEYYYNRYKKSDHYKTNLDLDSYLESPAGKAGGCCYVTRFLSEAPAGDSIEVTQSMIAEAKRNIDRVNVLGLFEQFDDFLNRLRGLLDRRLYVGHYNSNPAPLVIRERKLDAATQRRIEALCAPDTEIYQYARHLLSLG